MQLGLDNFEHLRLDLPGIEVNIGILVNDLDSHLWLCRVPPFDSRLFFFSFGAFRRGFRMASAASSKARR